MSKLLCILLGVVACFSTVYGTTLVANIGTTACTAPGSVPTGSGVSVTMVCTATADISTVVQASGVTTVSLVFYKGTTAVFQIAAAATTITEVAGQSGIASYTAGDVTVMVSTTVATVTYANFPTDGPGTWTCAIVDTATTANEASTAGADLTTFCSTYTLGFALTSGACDSSSGTAIIPDTAGFSVTCTIPNSKTFNDLAGIVFYEASTGTATAAFSVTAVGSTVTAGTVTAGTTTTVAATDTSVTVAIATVSAATGLTAARRATTWTCGASGVATATSSTQTAGASATSVPNTVACGAAQILGSLMVLLIAVWGSLML